MSITRSSIIKKAIQKSSISSEDGSMLFASLLLIIKTQAKSNKVKLSGFGTFSFKKTPKRLGRNPQTLVSYIIPSLNKLNFMPSNKIKEQIN
ncbi:HU family DNA-binding protein [Gammaproteobacteria bacterium]|nr:HU family DNA-binding protein [Gammaproteobacteria bacterium]